MKGLIFSCLVAIKTKQIFQLLCEWQNLIFKSYTFSILTVVAKEIFRKILKV